MGMPITFTKVLTAANGTIIATVQAHAAGGDLTQSASPVILDSQRRVSLLMTASNSGDTIIISGTNESGTPISENITIGATATTIVTQMDYKTVTAISVTTLTGNISAGTNATGSCPWIMANPWIPPAINIAAVSTLAASVVYTAEYTLDIDPCGVRNNAPLTAVSAFSAPQMTSLTSSQTAMITAGTSGQGVACSAWRVTITAGTGALQVSSLDGAGAF
jgi:hypothetical protein